MCYKSKGTQEKFLHFFVQIIIFTIPRRENRSGSMEDNDDFRNVCQNTVHCAVPAGDTMVAPTFFTDTWKAV